MFEYKLRKLSVRNSSLIQRQNTTSAYNIPEGIAPTCLKRLVVVARYLISVVCAIFYDSFETEVRSEQHANFAKNRL